MVLRWLGRQVAVRFRPCFRSVLGKDKDGKQQVWASTGQTSLKAGSTAKDLLEQTGLTLDAGESSWGWFLNGIYSPFDGKSYGWDAATNSYWRFYVNGKFADVAPVLRAP